MGKVEKYLFGKQILNLNDLKAVVNDSSLSFKQYLDFLDGCIRLSTGYGKTPTPEFRRGLFLGLMGISEVDETTVSLSDEVESHMRQSTEVMYDDLKNLAKKLNVKDVTISKWADDIAKAPCKEIVSFLDSDEGLFRSQLVSYLKGELDKRFNDQKSSESDHWFQVFTCPVGTRKSAFIEDYDEASLSTDGILNVFARRFIEFLYNAVKEKAGSDSAFGQYLNSIITNYEKRFVPLGFTETRSFSDCYVKQDINIDSTCKRVLLVGDSGCGKSMYLKKILLDYANDGLRAKDDDAIVLPVYYELKGFGDSKFTNLTDVLKNILFSQQVKKELVQSKFEQGKIVLLLDAMDEIALAKQKLFVAQLKNLMDSYGNLRIVISTRYGVSIIDDFERIHDFTKVIFKPDSFNFKKLMRNLGIRNFDSLRLSKRFSSSLSPAFGSILAGLYMNGGDEVTGIASIITLHFINTYKAKFKDDTPELMASLYKDIAFLAHFLMIKGKRNLETIEIVEFCSSENQAFPTFYSGSLSNMCAIGIVELSKDGVLSFSHTLFYEYYLFIYYEYFTCHVRMLPQDDEEKERILESAMKELVMDWDEKTGSIRRSILEIYEFAQDYDGCDVLKKASCWLMQKNNPWGFLFEGVRKRILGTDFNKRDLKQYFDCLDFSWKAGISIAGLEIVLLYYKLDDIVNGYERNAKHYVKADSSGYDLRAVLALEVFSNENFDSGFAKRLMTVIGNPERYLNSIKEDHGIKMIRNFAESHRYISDWQYAMYYRAGFEEILKYVADAEENDLDLLKYGVVVYDKEFEKRDKAFEIFVRLADSDSGYREYAFLNVMLATLNDEKEMDAGLMMRKMAEHNYRHSMPTVLSILLLGELYEKNGLFEDSRICFELAGSLNGDVHKILDFWRLLNDADFKGAGAVLDELTGDFQSWEEGSDLMVMTPWENCSFQIPMVSLLIFRAGFSSVPSRDKLSAELMDIMANDSTRVGKLIELFSEMYERNDYSLDHIIKDYKKEGLRLSNIDPEYLTFLSELKGMSTEEFIDLYKLK